MSNQILAPQQLFDQELQVNPTLSVAERPRLVDVTEQSATKEFKGEDGIKMKTAIDLATSICAIANKQRNLDIHPYIVGSTAFCAFKGLEHQITDIDMLFVGISQVEIQSIVNSDEFQTVISNIDGHHHQHTSTARTDRISHRIRTELCNYDIITPHPTCRCHNPTPNEDPYFIALADEPTGIVAIDIFSSVYYSDTSVVTPVFVAPFPREDFIKVSQQLIYEIPGDLELSAYRIDDFARLFRWLRYISYAHALSDQMAYPRKKLIQEAISCEVTAVLPQLSSIDTKTVNKEHHDAIRHFIASGMLHSYRNSYFREYLLFMFQLGIIQPFFPNLGPQEDHVEFTLWVKGQYETAYNSLIATDPNPQDEAFCDRIISYILDNQ